MKYKGKFEVQYLGYEGLEETRTLLLKIKMKNMRIVYVEGKYYDNNDSKIIRFYGRNDTEFKYLESFIFTPFFKSLLTVDRAYSSFFEYDTEVPDNVELHNLRVFIDEEMRTYRYDEKKQKFVKVPPSEMTSGRERNEKIWGEVNEMGKDLF